jgi:hypothetical protein
MISKFLTLLLLFLVSCSSTKERKPFMIVGKVEYPARAGAGMSLGYDFGSSAIKGDALNTQFKNFSYLSLGSSIGVGVGKNDFGFAAGYSLRYSFYSKDIKDPSDDTKYITGESFKSLNNRFYLSVSKLFYNDKRGTAYGVVASFNPYSETRYYSLNTIEGKRVFAHGTGYGGALFMSSRFGGCDISYRKLDYTIDLAEQIITIGCGVGFSLF